MYVDWKTKKNYSPKSIRLDSKNPRLHDVPENPRPGDIANLLITQFNSTIRKLAKSITDKGFFPHEDVLLVVEDNKLVVVEGNCRICVCQLLLNPSLAKDQRDRNYFARLAKKLSERAKSSFKKIPCSIAPSREQAYILIESRHTSAPINPWTPYAQGNFYRTLLKEGQTIQDLSEEFNRPSSDIIKKIRVTGVSDVIMHLPDVTDHPEEYTLDVKEIGEAAAIILRLLQSKESRGHFGLKIDIDDKGVLSSNLSEQDFVGVMSSLAKDALINKDAEGNPIIDTRVLNKEAGRIKYLSKYNGYLPQGTGEGCFNSSTFINRGRTKTELKQGPESGIPVESKPVKKSRTKRTADQWLINPNVEINIKNEKVRALVEEAQKVKWAAVPHTAGLLLRAIIECSLKTRMKELDLWKGVVINNQGNPIVGLSKLIKHTMANKNVLDDTELYEAFKRDFNDDKKRFKLVLDFIQHNDQHRIRPEDLEKIRTSTASLIRHLIETLPAAS